MLREGLPHVKGGFRYRVSVLLVYIIIIMGQIGRCEEGAPNPPTPRPWPSNPARRPAPLAVGKALTYNRRTAAKPHGTFCGPHLTPAPKKKRPVQRVRCAVTKAY